MVLTQGPLVFLQSYLTKRYEPTRKSNAFSDWESIIAVVLQGLILRPLLFKIFMNAFFYMEKSDLRNSADDSTVYAANTSVSRLKDILRKDFLKLSNCFHDNYLVLNPYKCHFTISGDDKQTFDLICQDNKIKNSQEALEETIDNKLNFTSHAKKLTEKANQKLHILTRVRHDMEIDQNKLLFSSFVKAEFGHCLLIWRFCSKLSKRLINNVKKILKTRFSR